MTEQSTTAPQSFDQPVSDGALPPARTTWTKLLVGAAVFLVALFVVARMGAEDGNESHFAFPEKVEGIRIVVPDRAPEARGREINARYNKAGDDLYSLRVSWYPETKLADVVGATPTRDVDGATCSDGAEIATCFVAKGDGVLRLSQEGVDVDAVRASTKAFLDGIN